MRKAEGSIYLEKTRSGRPRWVAVVSMPSGKRRKYFSRTLEGAQTRLQHARLQPSLYEAVVDTRATEGNPDTGETDACIRLEGIFQEVADKLAGGAEATADSTTPFEERLEDLVQFCAGLERTLVLLDQAVALLRDFESMN